MEPTLPAPADLLPLLAWSVPLTFGVLALLPGEARIRAARAAPALPLAGALALAGGIAALPAPARAFGTHLDGVTAIVLALVTTIGFVIARYAHTALAGEPSRGRHLRWLFATLAAVTTLVVADHLLVVAAAWTATSVVLHPLLTHYAERPGARLAAHKKFLVSRVADICLLLGLSLLSQAGSLRLSELDAVATSSETQLAAVLFVAAAALRSAQLPFHGWLTQVMEAPTHVSALLHAGVINIGGFLMIRLAPLLAQAPAAQLLLVGIGTTTAVVAGLVLRTRPSVKVGLAWSTCAQMGFMLAECGVGAWPLALLHLVAHSFYKAHAFLGSGGAVAAWTRRGTAPAATWAFGAAALLALYAGVHALVGVVVPYAPWDTGVALVAAGLLASLPLHLALDRWPHAPFARWLLPRLGAGLHLDDHVTRLSLRFWPAPAPRPTPTAVEVSS